MKKLLLAFCLLSLGISTRATVHTVGFVGFTYNPDTLVIQAGDTVTWNLTSIHNAIEVSQATWQANGTTSNGGFSIPFGGGSHQFTANGIYYYACQNHGGSGMKGVIIVGGLGVENVNRVEAINAYPSVVDEYTTLKIQSSYSGKAVVSIYNVMGQKVMTLPPVYITANEQNIRVDLSQLPAGPYFVKVMIGEEMKTIRIIKR